MNGDTGRDRAAAQPPAPPARRGRAGGHTGRRPGEPPTRAAILQAARAAFGDGGFDHATIRDIAARAGVDPALVHHYYGTKELLFEAALAMPVAPAMVLREVSDDRERLGEHIVRRFLLIWEEPRNLPIFMALLRSVVADEQVTDLVRRILFKEIFGPLAETLGTPDAALRANLVGTQLIGLALLRYVGKVEPLASADHYTIVAAVGPTVQRYLIGEIG